MSDAYESPRILPLDAPMTSRPPLDSRGGGRLETIGRHDVLDLMRTHGSPLVVFDADRLVESHDRFVTAFREHWPRTHLAYSVKTNYLSAVVACVYKAGATVEVVSGFEYEICRKLGIPGEDIHFNGPWKKTSEIEEAFRQGSQVNLDNLDEVIRTEEAARRLGGRYPVGIRVNMEVSYPPWDKFGFKLTSGEALRMARRIHAHPHLELRGLHMHIGTYIPNPDQYRKGAQAMVELALRIREATGSAPETIDMGGGYASTNRLRGQMLPGTATSPTPEMYAACLTEPLLEAREKHDYEPELVLEPGRVLVDECGDILTTVVSVKPLLGGGKSCILDAGVNILPTAYWYDHECVPVNVGKRPLERVKLFGPLCMQIDVVRPEVVLPAPRPGDVYALRRTGAYNFSQSMQFIYPRPAHLLLMGEDVHVIRRPEDVASVCLDEKVPEALRPGGEDAGA